MRTRKIAFDWCKQCEQRKPYDNNFNISITQIKAIEYFNNHFISF